MLQIVVVSGHGLTSDSQQKSMAYSETRQMLNRSQKAPRNRQLIIFECRPWTCFVAPSSTTCIPNIDSPLSTLLTDPFASVAASIASIWPFGGELWDTGRDGRDGRVCWQSFKAIVLDWASGVFRCFWLAQELRLESMNAKVFLAFCQALSLWRFMNIFKQLMIAGSVTIGKSRIAHNSYRRSWTGCTTSAGAPGDWGPIWKIRLVYCNWK